MAAENIKLGVCVITYDSVDLGLTLGGVEVEVTTTTHEVKVDSFGETPVKEFITGRTCMVKVPMVETTIANMAILMPASTVFSTGGSRIDVDVGISTDLLALAKVLKLSPVNQTGDEEDFIIPLAGIMGSMNFAYKIDQERVFMAEFKAYPDINDLLFTFGSAIAT